MSRLKLSMARTLPLNIPGTFPPSRAKSDRSATSRMPASPTDEELLSAALAGDERAFGELYRRWQGPMFRFARQMCGVDGAAEDVVQEVFVALIENGQQFDPSRGPLAAYLYGVARHQARRRLRTDGRYTALDEDRGLDDDRRPDEDRWLDEDRALDGHRVDDDRMLNTGRVLGGDRAESGGRMNGGAGVGLDSGADVGTLLDRRLSIDLVHRLVLTLPVPYREALVLCDLHELGYAEAAAALGCPVGTVRSRLHRARALLADKVRSGAASRHGLKSATRAAE
jgi:RNA polymerase sigma-70 factor, ECF subfamily